MKNKIKKLLGTLMVIVCSFMFTNCFKSVDNSTNEPKPPIEEEKQENQEVAKPLEKIKEEKVTEIKKQEKKEKQVVYKRRNNNEYIYKQLEYLKMQNYNLQKMVYFLRYLQEKIQMMFQMMY